MGSEKVTDSYMGLSIPTSQTSDPYWRQYVSAALALIAAHDHTTGKGTSLSQNSFTVTSNFDMRSFGVTSASFIGFSNPTALAVTPPNASIYYVNNDLYIKDGSGSIIQLTSGGALNTSLVGGFTGDYATANAFCSFTQSTGKYEFYTGTNHPSQDAMAEVAVGSLTIRSTTAAKNVYGLTIQSNGNIPANFSWTVPTAQASNPNNVLNIDSSGVITYVNADNYVMTSGSQSIGGVKTFSTLPVITDTNAPVTTQVVNKNHLTSVISALDKTSVGLSNVDNTADSNKSVASAAALTTPRTINGTSFSGTNNITINPPPYTGTNTGEQVLNYDGTNYTWVPNSGGSFPEVPNDTNAYVRTYGAWDTLTLDRIGDVEAPSPTTGDYLKFDGTNWVPAVVPSATSVTGEFTVGALGITAGNVVELVSDGAQNVQNIYHCEAPSISSLSTFDAGSATYIDCSKSGNNSAAIAWSDGGSIGRVCNFVGTNVGAALAFSGVNSARQISIDRLSDNEHAITFYDLTDANLKTKIITLSGTSQPTQSAAATASAANVQTATCALTSSNWFVAYANVTGNDADVILATSNGTNAPTLSSAVTLNSNGDASYLSLGRMTDTTAICAFARTTSTNGVTYSVTAGNPPTKSAEGTIDGTNNCTYITQSPIDSNHTLCAYNNATTSNGTLAVIQANGTNAPTVISRAVFEKESVSDIAITNNSTNTHSLIWRRVADNVGSSLSIGIDSNYNITISSMLIGFGTGNIFYNSISAITPTTSIAAFRGTGSDGYAGTLTLTPTPIISGQLLGISQDTATNGTATIDLGPIWQTTNTLTLGEEYFVNPAGGVSTNESTIFVGTANDTNALTLDLRGNAGANKINQVAITITGAYSITVPPGVTSAFIEICGGGGSSTTNTNHTGGNGADYISGKLFVTGGSVITGVVGGAATATSLTIAGSTYSAAGGTSGSGTTPPAANSASTANGLTLVVGQRGYIDYNSGSGAGGNSALGFGGITTSEAAKGYGAGSARGNSPTTGIARFTWIYG